MNWIITCILLQRDNESLKPYQVTCSWFNKCMVIYTELSEKQKGKRIVLTQCR